MTATAEQTRLNINFKVTEQTEIRQEEIRNAFVEGYIGIISIGTGWGFNTGLTKEMLKALKEEADPSSVSGETSDIDKIKEGGLVELGRLWLIPRENAQKIKRAEGFARRFVENRSIQFGKDKVHFIQTKHLADVMLGVSKHQDEFNAVIDTELIAPYEDIKTKMQQEHPKLWPLIADKYPTIEEIRRGIKYRFTVREMLFPKETKLVDIKAVMDRANADKSYRDQLGMEASEIKLRLEREMAKQKEQKVEEFQLLITDTVNQIRGKVVDALTTTLNRRADKKPIREQNLASIREAIAYVKEMDFVDDTGLQERLARITTLLDSGGRFTDSERDASELENVLRETVQFVNESTQENAQQLSHSYFAKRRISV